MVYVASSWKNDRQPEVVSTLRRAGQIVDYDSCIISHDRRHCRFGHDEHDAEGPLELLQFRGSC
jgi:hypothetical protein